MTLFKSKKGRELQREIVSKKGKTFVPGAGLPKGTSPKGSVKKQPPTGKYLVVLRILWHYIKTVR